MKKTVRLVKAELRKIFLRPTIFILAALVILTIFASTFFFSPIKRTSYDCRVTGANVDTLYQNFMTADNPSMDTFTSLNRSLAETSSSINFYINSKEGNNSYSSLKNVIDEYSRYYKSFHSWFDSPTLTIDKAYDELEKLRSRVTAIQTVALGLDKNVTHYITDQTYNGILSLCKEIAGLIPVRSASSFSVETLKNHVEANIDQKNYEGKFYDLLGQINPIEYDAKDFSEIQKNYFDSNSIVQKKKNEILIKIREFRNNSEKTYSKQEEDLQQIRSYFNEYKALTEQAQNSVKSRILLLLAGNKSDVELNQFLTFEEFERYEVTSFLTLNDFFISSDSPEAYYQYAFDYMTEGNSTSQGWDFVYFAMEIASVIVIIISIYLATYMVSGEQASGTMKLEAIRPYSRAKLLRSKMYATLLFMIFFIFLSAVVAMLFGGFMFGGLSLLPVVSVFNATSAMVLSPIVLILIDLLSIILKGLLFVSFAFMISVLFKSHVGSVVVSMAALVLTLISNALLAPFAWFRFFPFANLDFYRFFKISDKVVSPFSTALISDTSFVMSACYFLCLLILINVISFINFRKKDLA